MIARLFAWAFILPAVASAADGDLVTVFGNQGLVIEHTVADTPYDVFSLNGSVELTDGSFLVAAYLYATAAHQPHAGVLRYDARGNRDVSFGDHGVFSVPISANNPYGGEGLSIIVLSENRFVLVGRALAGGSNPNRASRSCTLLSAFDAQGVGVTSFGGASGGTFCFDFGVAGAVVQLRFPGNGVRASDGGFFLSGPNSANGQFGIARFDAEGTLVPAFGNAGKCYLSNTAGAAMLRRDGQGRLNAIGIVEPLTPNPRRGQPFGAVRIDENCVRDETYKPKVQAMDTSETSLVELEDATFDAQDRLIVGFADERTPLFSPQYGFSVARFDTSGQPDTTFNGGAQQLGFPGLVEINLHSDAYDHLLGLVAAENGLYLSGMTSTTVGDNPSPSWALLRLLPDGAFDSSFKSGPIAGVFEYDLGISTTAVGRLTRAHDGTLIASGNMNMLSPSCVSGFLARVATDSLFVDAFEVHSSVPVCTPAR